MNRRARFALLAAVSLATTNVLAATTLELPRASFLGVQVAPLTDEARARLKLGNANGALVAALVPGGSGEAAGLREDDVVVAVDDQAVAGGIL